MEQPTETTTEAPEASVWNPPAWMVNLVLIGFVLYLLVGLGFAIYDAATHTQASASMAVLSFFLEIVVWPAKLLIPVIQ